MASRSRTLLWIFALLGLGAASWSAWVHANLLRNPLYTSVCDINSTLSCSDAYLSPYGSFLGIPVALPGVLFFVVVLTLLAAERRATPAVAANIPGYVFATSTIGLSFVLYLAYGAFIVLKAICILCLLTYVAVIGLFLVSGAVSTVPMQHLPNRALRDLRAVLASPAALAVLLLLVVGSVAAFAYFPRESDRLGGVAHAVESASGGASGGAAGTAANAGAAAAAAAAPAQSLPAAQRAEVEQWFDMQPRSIVPEDPQGATVLIVKFHDYQCPSCGRVHFDYKPILKRYAAESPGKVRYIVRDFPLSSQCNPTGGSNPFSCDAAVAVKAAQAANKGEAMADWIFEHQQTLTRENLRQAARDIAGVADFDAAYKKYIDQVKADASAGALLQVRATPTFFINGVKIEGGLAPPYFDAVIAHALKKGGQ